MIGPGQDIIAVGQASRPRKQRETEWQKGAGESAPQSQCTPKNSGTYEAAAAEVEKDTIRKRPAVH